MGYAYREAAHTRTVFCEPFDKLPCWSDYACKLQAQDDYDDVWQDLTDTLIVCLPTSWGYSPETWRSGHPGGKVLAANGLHELLLEEGPGGYGYAYISVQPLPELEGDALWGLACYRLNQAADRCFERLSQAYDLRIPLGYVSAPWTPAVVKGLSTA